jgi:hypothetical protein
MFAGHDISCPYDCRCRAKKLEEKKNAPESLMLSGAFALLRLFIDRLEPF